LSKRLKELEEKATSSDPKPQLLFDKDDEDTLNFVTAAANLRSKIFHIPQKTKFDTKRGLTGNTTHLETSH
jgi:ubiquitin-like 1-activating enzyme E1 B